MGSAQQEVSSAPCPASTVPTPTPPPPLEILSSMKLVLGAKKAGGLLRWCVLSFEVNTNTTLVDKFSLRYFPEAFFFL